MKEKIDARLTHRIIVDSGQWTRGSSEAEARKLFADMHSTRSLRHAQVWAVTPNTRINEHGAFSAPRAEWVEAVRIS